MASFCLILMQTVLQLSIWIDSLLSCLLLCLCFCSCFHFCFSFRTLIDIPRSGPCFSLFAAKSTKIAKWANEQKSIKKAYFDLHPFAGQNIQQSVGIEKNFSNLCCCSSITFEVYNWQSMFNTSVEIFVLPPFENYYKFREQNVNQ